MALQNGERCRDGRPGDRDRRYSAGRNQQIVLNQGVPVSLVLSIVWGRGGKGGRLYQATGEGLDMASSPVCQPGLKFPADCPIATLVVFVGEVFAGQEGDDLTTMYVRL